MKNYSILLVAFFGFVLYACCDDPNPEPNSGQKQFELKTEYTYPNGSKPNIKVLSKSTELTIVNSNYLGSLNE